MLLLKAVVIVLGGALVVAVVIGRIVWKWMGGVYGFAGLYGSGQPIGTGARK